MSLSHWAAPSAQEALRGCPEGRGGVHSPSLLTYKVGGSILYLNVKH